MTDGGFLGGREFGESLSQCREVEHGIVSEAAGSAKFAEDHTFGLRTKTRDVLAVFCDRDDANEAACALLVGNVFHPLKYKRVVCIVVGIAVLGLRSVAGGANSGLPIQRVDLDAGI